jgi:hypothetical protein
MPRASTGYMKLIGGVWHVRLSRGSGAARERPWYSLGVSDRRAAETRRKQLVAKVAAGVFWDVLEACNEEVERGLLGGGEGGRR